jgi:hypothetical protein
LDLGDGVRGDLPRRRLEPLEVVVSAPETEIAIGFCGNETGSSTGVYEKKKTNAVPKRSAVASS